MVGGKDRAGLLRLASYMLRPPFSRERILARDDGQIEIKLKKSCHHATRDTTFYAFTVEPLEVITDNPYTIFILILLNLNNSISPNVVHRLATG